VDDEAGAGEGTADAEDGVWDDEGWGVVFCEEPEAVERLLKPYWKAAGIFSGRGAKLFAHCSYFSRR